MKSGIAVKSFIVNQENKVLVVKREKNDTHMPEEWEIPGGRIENEETLLEGVKRETKEETNLDIEVLEQLNTQEFTRQDGERIKMVIFLCKPLTESVVLSEEHTEFDWIELDEVIKLNDFFKEEVEIYKNKFLE